MEENKPTDVKVVEPTELDNVLESVTPEGCGFCYIAFDVKDMVETKVAKPVVSSNVQPEYLVQMLGGLHKAITESLLKKVPAEAIADAVVEEQVKKEKGDEPKNIITLN